MHSLRTKITLLTVCAILAAMTAANDQYGHEKGDIYLKTASGLICRVFQHSPVFRTGGDEFTVLLENEDYRRREALRRHFEEASREVSAAAAEPWEQVHVSLGLADYDPDSDSAVEDVARRADWLMYENKRQRKAAAGSGLSVR